MLFLVNVWLIHMFSISFFQLHRQRGTSLLPLWPCEGPKTFFRIISLQLYVACSPSLSTCLQCNAHHVAIRPQSPGASFSPPPSLSIFSIYSFWFMCSFLAKYQSVPFIIEKKQRHQTNKAKTQKKRCVENWWRILTAMTNNDVSLWC